MVLSHRVFTTNIICIVVSLLCSLLCILSEKENIISHEIVIGRPSISRKASWIITLLLLLIQLSAFLDTPHKQLKYEFFAL